MCTATTRLPSDGVAPSMHCPSPLAMELILVVLSQVTPGLPFELKRMFACQPSNWHSAVSVKVWGKT